MMRSITLTDHDEIRDWAEARGGRPVAARTGRPGDPKNVRIEFPGAFAQRSASEISWDDFFERFEAAGLALVVSERTATGQRSNVHELVIRKPARGGTKKTAAGRGVKRAAARRPAARTKRAGAVRGRKTSAAASTKPKKKTSTKIAARSATTSTTPRRGANGRRTTAARTKRAARTGRGTRTGGRAR
jgi:hypothetical protein